MYSSRPSHAIQTPQEDVTFHQYFRKEGDSTVYADREWTQPFAEHVLCDAEIVVNGVFQKTSDPMTFVSEDEVKHLPPNVRIVDVSCDPGMGFFFATETHMYPESGQQPTADMRVPIPGARNGKYYGGGHTPTFLYADATREIGAGVARYLPTVMKGEVACEQNPVLEPALELAHGEIRNEHILDFQRRSPVSPHFILER